ncbi:E3 ubiquitin-protein ligase itt1 like [Verticillium longisporum]|uniref:RBR-type E3 ubiquitin transferase n=1 Tax=Verticillium longisporum TaxID=100787 RepID=A0A8I3AV05_VERLO|nr:E3 ubiquitin-protein ligase itt1 like [Verticillium longisporum]
MTMPVGRGVDHHRHQPHHHRASRHYEDEDEEDEDDDEDEDEDEDEDRDESPAGSRRNLRRGMSPRSRNMASFKDAPGTLSQTTISTAVKRTGVGDAGDDASLLEAPTPPRSSVSRPRRRRHSQVIYTEIVPPTLRRAHTASETHVTSHSTTSSNRRHSVLGAFLGPGMQGHGSNRRVKQLQCLACMDELPADKVAKLKCGHRMCSSCLKRKFKMSITDPVEMPPKCCAEHIPLKHVERLFPTDFKKTWNKKFAEFSTRNRVYCPAKRCGEWIKPANIHREDGRKCGRCSRCRLKVCCACHGKWHGSRECPKDEETTIFLQQAKEAGWQRCHRCKAMVELKEGCNHMTCRCGAEFCMICGLKWKSCDCPWFNHDTPEDDSLEDMHIPMSLGRDRLGRADGSPPGRGTIHPVPDLTAPMSMRPRVPDAYEDPPHDPLMRRLQERQESNLARRLHVRDDDGGDMSESGPRPSPDAASGTSRGIRKTGCRWRVCIGRQQGPRSSTGLGGTTSRRSSIRVSDESWVEARHDDAAATTDAGQRRAANVYARHACGSDRTHVGHGGGHDVQQSQ